MTFAYIIGGSALFSILIVLGWRLVDDFMDSNMAWLVGTFTFALCLFITVLLTSTSEERDRIQEARSQATKQCQPGKARIFEEHEKEIVVFSCSNDGRLRTISYKR